MTTTLAHTGRPVVAPAAVEEAHGRRRGRAAGSAIVRVGCRVMGCSWSWCVDDKVVAVIDALLARKGHEEEHILRGECPDRTLV